MMWNHWKIFDKMTEYLNYDLFGGPKWPKNLGLWGLSFYIPTKVAPMSLQIKFQVNIAETFQENRRKPIYWPIWGLKIRPTGPFFTHKNLLKNFPQTCKIPIVSIFCNKISLKIRSKNKNSTYSSFWAILLCTFTSNIGTIGWKLREPIRFEKSWRTPDGSLSDRHCWLWQKRS